MNWLKNNLGLVFSGLVFIALLGVAGWQIHAAFGRRSEVEATLLSKQDRINNLRNTPIYPSKENIEAIRSDRLKLQKLYSSIQGKLSGTSVNPREIKRDTDFNLFLVETQGELRKAAEGSNTNLASFAFGFERYKEAFPCSSSKVNKKDCEQLLGSLAKQIVVIDKITRLLFKSGTDDLLDVKRAQVPAELPGSDLLPWVPPVSPKPLFISMPFQFKFACDKTDVLKIFLNNLAQADQFFAVKNVTIETESQIVSPQGQPMSRTELTADALAKVEIKHRLIVTVRIDWLEFASTTNSTSVANK